jgi:hypothetical protein
VVGVVKEVDVLGITDMVDHDVVIRSDDPASDHPSW